MKKVSLFVLALCCFFSCQKDKVALNNGLIGRWELTDYYVPIGIAGGWHKATSGEKIIKFEANGNFYDSTMPTEIQQYVFTASNNTVSIYSSTNQLLYKLHITKLNPDELEWERGDDDLVGLDRYKAVK